MNPAPKKRLSIPLLLTVFAACSSPFPGGGSMTDAHLTDSARDALQGAREEAIALGHDYVGTEHILLGLSRDPDVAATFRRLGITSQDVRSRIELVVRRGHAMHLSTVDLPFTSRSLKVLDFSKAEARNEGREEIQSEDILLGLLREDKGIACEILNQLGITDQRLRSDLATG